MSPYERSRAVVEVAPWKASFFWGIMESGKRQTFLAIIKTGENPDMDKRLMKKKKGEQNDNNGLYLQRSKDPITKTWGTSNIYGNLQRTILFSYQNSINTIKLAMFSEAFFQAVIKWRMEKLK